MITYSELLELDRLRLKHFVKRQGIKTPQAKERVFVAKKNQYIIGIARVEVFTHQAWLRGLFIAPDQRKNGYGSGLIGYLCQQLQQPCCGFIQSDLHSFYQALGFHAYPEGDLEALLFEKFKLYQRTKPRLAIWCRPNN